MKKSNNSRRDFVKNTSVLGMGIISTPKTFFINKGVENKDQIIGHRDFRYKIDKKSFLKPHVICIEEDKNLYVPQWNSKNTYPIKLTRI